MAGPARYLDPAIIARLGTIDLKARTIVEGFLTGLHRSPYKGFSVEFAEYRQYLPGDDLATLDVKAEPLDGAHEAARRLELDAQILDLEQRPGGPGRSRQR